LSRYLQHGVFSLLAAVVAASIWFYFDRILVAHQVADAAAHQRPRGNLSDLYPRWLGARELLLHNRNPYGEDISLEIEKGYYGRALDPSRPDDPKDHQGFAYPVYVVFLLAPVIDFPFHDVQILFHWVLISLTSVSVWLWLRSLRWQLPTAMVVSCMLLTLGSVPAVQGVKLQQLSLLVAALLAGASACIASSYLSCGGVLLALATIKPQLAWPLVAWLLLWVVADWRARRRLVFAFGAVMSLLFAGAEIILPGWLGMFFEAIRQYHQYTQNQSVIEVILNGALGGSIGGALGHFGAEALSAIAVLTCAWLVWKLRWATADNLNFSMATALVLALTVLIVPMYAPYNQVLLLPAILLLVRKRAVFISRSWGSRLAFALSAFAVAWQWIASLCLTVAYLLGAREQALDAWKLPFAATFALPVLIFGLAFLCVRNTRIATS
jgi:hypothetical protein